MSLKISQLIHYIIIVLHSLKNLVVKWFSEDVFKIVFQMLWFITAFKLTIIFYNTCTLCKLIEKMTYQNYSLSMTHQWYLIQGMNFHLLYLIVFFLELGLEYAENKSADGRAWWYDFWI